MDRRGFTLWGIGLAAGGVTATDLALDTASATEDGRGAGKAHRVAIQVSSEDHRTQELALGNARNYAEHYKAKGEPFQIEIVVFGPGYGMVRDDMSMVKGNIETLKRDLGSALTVAACHNTRAGIAASMGKSPEAVPLIAEATETPSGIVRLAELQEQGWAYVRP